MSINLIHDGEPTPIADIFERDGNPRSDVTEITTMAEAGQLTAIRARHTPNGIEYYEGSRRVHTAKLLGWTHIGVKFTDDLTDAQVDELRLVYGSGAEPLTALDEGAGYAALQAAYQHSVASIARTVRKSEEYVRQRLTLNTLLDPIKSLLKAGKIGINGALHLAQVTEPAAVEKLVRRIDSDFATRGERLADVTVRSYAKEYLLRLDQACFDIKDPDLTGAGSCLECPKRSGKQMALIGLEQPTDGCTDFKCWTAKQDAHWSKMSGACGHVLAKADMLGPSGPLPGSGYVVAKEAGPDTYCVRDGHGRTHLLMKQAKPETRVQPPNYTAATAQQKDVKAPMPTKAPTIPELRPGDRRVMLDRCFARIKESPATAIGMIVRAACVQVYAEHLEEVCDDRGLMGEQPPAERLALAAVAGSGLEILLDVLAAGSDDALRAADQWKAPEKPAPESKPKRKKN